MSSISMWRLFLRWEKAGRLPSFGNAGYLYATPIIERQMNAFKQTSTKVSGLNRAIRLSENLTSFRLGRQFYSTAVSTKDVEKSDAARVTPKKKVKTAESPKILLITEAHNVTAITLEEASKLAVKKALHLVPDTSHHLSKDKKVYKLVTNTEYLKIGESEAVDSNESSASMSREDKDKEKRKQKEPKTVIVKSKIAEHDIISKVRQMNRWIEKGNTIKLMIGQTGEKGDAQNVYNIIEENMRESGARFLQKVVKGEQIRCQIVPPKEGQKEAVKKGKAGDATS